MKKFTNFPQWGHAKLTTLIAILLVCSSSVTQATVYYVSTSGSSSNSGLSWAQAYDDPQDAIDAASVGDPIWVAQGTYIPTEMPDGVTSTDDRDKTIHWNKDLVILGGFDGTETVASERDWGANPTILSGLLSATNTAYHVMVIANLTEAAVLDGFTLQHRAAIVNELLILYCSTRVFNRNTAGAMNHQYSSPPIVNFPFSENNESFYGGAMYNN